MQHQTIHNFLSAAKTLRPKGPLAMIFVEDLVEVESTVNHHLGLGFGTIILFAPPQYEAPDFHLPDPAPETGERLPAPVHIVHWEPVSATALEDAVNAVAGAFPGLWMYYCYNAEYLQYPFSENRSIGEMLAFHAEERRDAMLCYVVDLYSGNIDTSPSAVSLEDAHFDKTGYYALARPDPANHNHPKTRQLDFYGGLRWRFEEHIPQARRKIDRIALFRAAPEVKLLPGNVFSDEEYNTYACEWHHNLTAAICSFRTAKALRSNPGSKFDIHTFTWHNSARINWSSQQLMDLGLMEPGQWF